MKLTHDVFLEQQQKLIMTPELRQAIAVLQMSTLELGEYIQKEMVENPFLEEKEEETGEVQSEKETGENKLEQWMEYLDDRGNGPVRVDKEEEITFENFVTRRPSLYEHLEFQLRMTATDPEQFHIGEYLLGCIDEYGYLVIDINEVAANLQVSPTAIEQTIEMIQSFHPHGVGARDLAECLLIQLHNYGKDEQLIEKIIHGHLEDIARGRMNKIASSLGIPVQQAQDLCDLIRTLDPKPGLQYGNDQEIKYIIPDVVVEKIDGEYVVIINDMQFPHLIINQTYKKFLRQPNAFDENARKYLEEKMGSAIWLIRSIEQRRMTLYKVANAIVEFQKEFLDNGVACLKPLTLREIAEIVDVHESTVSRATNNKYMQTPQGLFELKFFFSTGIHAYGGEEKVSARSIKHILEEIVASEDPMQPLSDEAIAKIIQSKGIRISRRTVAKYRQELGIAATMSRRRY